MPRNLRGDVGLVVRGRSGGGWRTLSGLPRTTGSTFAWRTSTTWNRPVSRGVPEPGAASVNRSCPAHWSSSHLWIPWESYWVSLVN